MSLIFSIKFSVNIFKHVKIHAKTHHTVCSWRGNANSPNIVRRTFCTVRLTLNFITIRKYVFFLYQDRNQKLSTCLKFYKNSAFYPCIGLLIVRKLKKNVSFCCLHWSPDSRRTPKVLYIMMYLYPVSQIFLLLQIYSFHEKTLDSVQIQQFEEVLNFSIIVSISCVGILALRIC